MIVTILVSPKRGVLDPEGRAIENSLHGLGYREVRSVVTGRQLTLDIDADDEDTARQKAAKMCETLLVNTVIEDYEIRCHPENETRDT